MARIHGSYDGIIKRRERKKRRRTPCPVCGKPSQDNCCCSWPCVFALYKKVLKKE